MTRKTVLAAVAAAAALAVPAQAHAADKTIVEIAAGDSNFSTLVSLVKEAGLAETLSGGNFTVFAPTNDAFAKVPKATLAKLGKDKDLLKSVLLYHAVPGTVKAETVVKLNGKFVKTVNGKKIRVTVSGANVKLNGNTNVVKTDIEATHGVIHVIDRVLLPPSNIVETAADDKNFSTLVSLVKKAGLAKTLSGGDFTIFAPTNAAFKKVPKATLAKLAKDKKLLKSVLLYHAVKGAVYSDQVVKLNGKKVKTVNGKKVKIKVAGGKVFLNGSTRVTKTDIGASNGVIHVINKVLLPPSK